MIHLISCGYDFIHRDGITIDRPAGAGNYAFVFFSEFLDFLLQLNFPLDTLIKAIDPLLITRCIRELQSIYRQGGSLRDKIIDSEIRTLFMKLRNLFERAALPDKMSRYFHEFSNPPTLCASLNVSWVSRQANTDRSVKKELAVAPYIETKYAEPAPHELLE
jgi:AraC family transcriptional regulator of arabinose operon